MSNRYSAKQVVAAAIRRLRCKPAEYERESAPRDRGRIRRSHYVWISAAVAGSLFAAAGCGKKQPAAIPVQAASQNSASAVAVTARPVKTGAISQTVDVTGSLVALQDVIVGAKQAGKIASVYFNEGDPVRAGQMVALMDTSELEGQLQQQQANLQA
ncbi:MAG TPA: biotin/lipoyl-binding protein, partial [Chthonomonadales bacterium]|nr:biotin/lipoyl-binding protein [Chthonomonadales bacterium]